MDIVWIIVAYFVGSIPFTLIIGKFFKNMDIRDYGSGNLGGTNAIRVLGPKVGIPAGALDISKAFLMVALAKYGVIDFGFSPLYLGVVASIGHCYPIFAQFKGGKAVSTTLGAALAFAPVITLASLVIAVSVIYFTKFVSVGSTILGVVLVLMYTIVPGYTDAIWPQALMLLLIMVRHIPNYKRLRSGSENKVKINRKNP